MSVIELGILKQAGTMMMESSSSSSSRQRWLLGLLAALVMWVAADPLGMGPLGDFAHHYRPMTHPLASYRAVMSSWPRDSASRLQTAFVHSQGRHIHGPESLIFDTRGFGPYAGLADGRVVRFSSSNSSWDLFAIPSPRWNASCLTSPSNLSTRAERTEYEERCGRPLGLRFNKADDNLYFADAYYGLLAVGPEGGVARVLTQQAGTPAQPIKFANDLDIHSNGSIFFTDSSTRHNRLDHQRILLETENTGKLLRYDPSTGETFVVLTGLNFPNGVQLSDDESFLLLTETTNCRVLRYWLEGPKKGSLEVFANLPGFPDNVRMNAKGQYWVAIDCCRTRLQEVFSIRPWLRHAFFRLPVPISWLYKIVGMRMFTVITLFDQQGNIIDSLEDYEGHAVKLVSEVQQKDNTLWIGSVYHKQVATFHYDS
ncbi:hypothetical protein L7F22_053086 [Adiantum nelumboides]|nr:hypothetical protein [Adiantum nelumboides]